MREVAESIELASTLPALNVLPQEYVRLLGYPRGFVLEGQGAGVGGAGAGLVCGERPAVVLRAPGGDSRTSRGLYPY